MLAINISGCILLMQCLGQLSLLSLVAWYNEYPLLG